MVRDADVSARWIGMRKRMGSCRLAGERGRESQPAPAEEHATATLSSVKSRGMGTLVKGRNGGLALW